MAQITSKWGSLATLFLACGTLAGLQAQTFSLEYGANDVEVTFTNSSGGLIIIGGGNRFTIEAPDGAYPSPPTVTSTAPGYAIIPQTGGGDCASAGTDAFIFVDNGATSILPGQTVTLFSISQPAQPCFGDISFVNEANPSTCKSFINFAQAGVPTPQQATIGTAAVSCDPNAAVPVELEFFKATPVEQTAVLTWRTASEESNAGFEVHRNAPGSDWVKIGFVEGAGSTSEAQSYTFTDEAPASGTNYYRLRQVDFDGSAEYSGIASASFLRGGAVELYPNPSQGLFRLTLPETPEGAVSFRVVDASGRVVHERTEADAAFRQYDFELDFLPAGTYQLRTSSSLGSSVERLVILNR